MQQRELGKDGPKIGAIGLGCMSFAGFYGPTDEAEAHATLAKALDLGVTHLDTARIYGLGVSETIIGSFLKQNKHHFSIPQKAELFRNLCVSSTIRRNIYGNLWKDRYSV